MCVCDGFKFIAIGDDMQTLDNRNKRRPLICFYWAFLFFLLRSSAFDTDVRDVTVNDIMKRAVYV